MARSPLEVFDFIDKQSWDDEKKSKTKEIYASCVLNASVREGLNKKGTEEFADELKYLQDLGIEI